MNLLRKNKILVIGAGAFGRAIASIALYENNEVTILSRDANEFLQINATEKVKKCQKYTFDEFKDDFTDFDLIILAIPCQSLQDVCEWMKKKWFEIRNAQNMESLPKINLISAAKGIEQKTLRLPSQILSEFWGDHAAIGTLSGPSFAKEMLLGLPTCVVFATKDIELQKSVPKILHSPFFRVYDSKDVIGVEVSGALKNVIAMVAGAVDGLELGCNARAAVMTRGLSEIVRVGLKLGADPMTFLGLSGAGDLILTCTGELSRNRQFGYRLALGESQEHIKVTMGQTIEGYATACSAYELCSKIGVKASILETVYRVLYEDFPIKKAVTALIERQQGSEFKEI